mmetsp:Transcript_20964/g.43710  ORF Transcript_20964/g.43710 Transcript_20964/m.43710 type:complete len:273 (-) Transcript_20964:638-1456(-)
MDWCSFSINRPSLTMMLLLDILLLHIRIIILLLVSGMDGTDVAIGIDVATTPPPSIPPSLQRRGQRRRHAQTPLRHAKCQMRHQDEFRLVELARVGIENDDVPQLPQQVAGQSGLGKERHGLVDVDVPFRNVGATGGRHFGDAVSREGSAIRRGVGHAVFGVGCEVVGISTRFVAVVAVVVRSGCGVMSSCILLLLLLRRRRMPPAERRASPHRSRRWRRSVRRQTRPRQRNQRAANPLEVRGSQYLRVRTNPLVAVVHREPLVLGGNSILK